MGIAQYDIFSVGAAFECCFFGYVQFHGNRGNCYQSNGNGKKKEELRQKFFHVLRIENI
jgi:hypothetical protein